MLQVCKKLNLLNKISVHLVEISPVLSKIQAKKLCIESKDSDLRIKYQKNSITHYREGITKNGVKIYWYYSITDIPKKFSIFIAQEFFDALPIHKFQVLKNKNCYYTKYMDLQIYVIFCFRKLIKVGGKF